MRCWRERCAHQGPRAGCRPEDEVTAVNRGAVLISARLPFGVDAERDETRAAPEAWCVLEQHVDPAGLRLVPPRYGQAVFILGEPCSRRCGIGFAFAAVDVETNDARAWAGGNTNQRAGVTPPELHEGRRVVGRGMETTGASRCLIGE